MLSSGTVEYNKLSRQVLANVWNIINNTDNVPIPSGLPSNHPLVKEREPLDLGITFKGYPIIVVKPAVSSSNKGTLDSSKKFLKYTIPIIIYTADRSSNSSGIPQGAEMNDLLTDQVITALNSNDHTLLKYGMKNLDWSITYDWINVNGQPLFMREITVTFDQLQTVSI